jgi:hypothetical protein
MAAAPGFYRGNEGVKGLEGTDGVLRGLSMYNFCRAMCKHVGILD